MARARRKWTSEEDALLRGVVSDGEALLGGLSLLSQSRRIAHLPYTLIACSCGPVASIALARIGQIGSRSIKQRLPQEMVEQSGRWYC